VTFCPAAVTLLSNAALRFLVFLITSHSLTDCSNSRKPVSTEVSANVSAQSVLTVISVSTFALTFILQNQNIKCSIQLYRQSQKKSKI
jgi:hypothetical protein